MQKVHERGYVGLLGLVITFAVIALLYGYSQAKIPSSTASSTPATIGLSSIEHDVRALDSAKALQDVSAKRAAEINAMMQ